MPKISSLLPSNVLPGSRATRRIVRCFAEQFGLVYFGFVSQRSDDHHIVRGLTVSNKHSDDHYCIGTYDTYDTVFVERSDSVTHGRKHVWHIMEFDLKTNSDIPHVFIGSSKTHGFQELLKTKYPSLTALDLQSHTGIFSSQFDMYIAPGHTYKIDQLIPTSVAQVMNNHFKGLAVEITDRALYVYSEKPHLSAHLLETMITNGVWLASELDKNSRHL